jgi:hypothetical protein
MNSPIFGEYQNPTKSDKLVLDTLALNFPVALFRRLNKALNARGYQCHVTRTGETLKVRPKK